MAIVHRLAVQAHLRVVPVAAEPALVELPIRVVPVAELLPVLRRLQGVLTAIARSASFLAKIVPVIL